MILFKNDWLKYPSAIRDYDTKNESFKRLVGLYHRMGVKNCDFLLALYQPELVGVDPHSPDLTEDQMQMIALEAFSNPWYCFREVIRIPVSGAVPIPFRANRGNIALYWSFLNHVDFGLLQPRQTGKSTSTDALMISILYIWGIKTTISLITKDDKLRQGNMERLKELRDSIPPYIYEFDPRKDANNSELLTNMLRENRYKTAVGRTDRIAADKLGRGLTVPIMHFDELAYISNIEYSLPVALASGGAARDQAKEFGQMYGNIYTTTAGSINDRDGRFAYNFLTSGAIWSEHYFDLKNQEEFQQVVERNKRGKKTLIYGAFNHRQLGYSDEWLARKLAESAQEGELADRDYMNVWTTGTQGTPLSPEEKKVIKASERDPVYTEIGSDMYVLRWYIPEAEIDQAMNATTPIMGLDASEAMGGDSDSITVTILHPETHAVMACGSYNETNVTTLTNFFCRLMLRFRKMVFIPERKSTAISILDTMFIQLPLKGEDPFKRIYNRIVDEQDVFENEFKDVMRTGVNRPSSTYARFKRYFGYNTSGTGRHARSQIYGDCFKSAVRLGGRRVTDKVLSNELLSLVIKNGRIDHQTGGHDDQVISWLLPHWLLTKGRNLSHYGIDASRVFREASESNENLTIHERYQRQKEQAQLAEFDQLMESLKATEDPMAVMRLEMRLRQLSQTLDVSSNTGVGIDAMIQQAKEERSRAIKLNRNRHRDIRMFGLR